MFPNEATENISLLLKEFDNNIHGVVGELLESSKTNAVNFTFESSTLGKSADTPIAEEIEKYKNAYPKSAKALLKNLASKTMIPEQTVDLQVDRSKLWRTALGFYKTMIHTPEKLRYELRIDFIDEDGIDAGALKREFFELLLKQLNANMFEGLENRRIPKKDSSLERMFHTAGIIIAHSILQGGPGFPCLCPSAYHYLLHLDKEKALLEMQFGDIPLNAATNHLIDFINKVAVSVDH